MSSSRLYSREDVRLENNGLEKVMIVIHNSVYDVTSYLEAHPGGSDVLLEQGGKDGTEQFDIVGHSIDARELMEQYKVGELVPEEHTKVKHNLNCSDIVYSVWTYLVPLTVAVFGTVCYRLYKRH